MKFLRKLCGKILCQKLHSSYLVSPNGSVFIHKSIRPNLNIISAAFEKQDWCDIVFRRILVKPRRPLRMSSSSLLVQYSKTMHVNNMFRLLFNFITTSQHKCFKVHSVAIPISAMHLIGRNRRIRGQYRIIMVPVYICLIQKAQTYQYRSNTKRDSDFHESLLLIYTKAK